MASFIEYGGQLVMPAPFKLINSKMFGFFFEGDKARLQDLLDQRVNFASSESKRQYTVFNNDIMATFVTTPQAVSLDPQGQAMGYSREKELVTWILTLESVKVGDSWKPNRLLWFIPYIFVNNILPVVAGREIYGIPKAMGSLTIPASPEEAFFFSTSAYGFKTFSPSSVFDEYPLMTVKHTATAQPGNIKKDWTDSVSALKDLSEVVRANQSLLDKLNIKLCLNGITDLLSARIPSLMLKQFRGINNSTDACYQALIEAPFQISKFYGGGLLHNHYELEINRMASFPLTDDLGIVTGQTAKAAFWINLDFTLEQGKEIWRA